MIAPDTPPDETQRLRTLHSLRILDTGPEERFDRITRLARRLFDVPIALVSLVDEQRQWFKSRQGLDATETPREISFCGHAILGDDIFYVPDATRDERFHDNPLVCSQPDIRFYAGYPIKAPNGRRIGTLCVIDARPRELDAAGHELLRELGGLVEEQIKATALAVTDALTAIPNRRGFQAAAGQLLATAARSRTSSVLIVLDLDGFKRINDEESHEAGDRALVDFARCLLRTCREADAIGRTGGDEFCALLWDTDEAGAARMIERLAECVAEVNLTRRGRLPLAFSAGMAAAPASGARDLESLVMQADARMFANKALRKAAAAAPAVDDLSRAAG
jgi:diguanylate cyclase (GGDEF)-like protein